MDEDEVRASVDGWALPHPNVLTQFVAWVVWQDGCDERGTFIGWCPLHDPGKEVEASAEYNFTKGIMRCVGTCHHGKRAMSLQNVAERMRDVGND